MESEKDINKNIGRTTVSDLHNEGIDIVKDSENVNTADIQTDTQEKPVSSQNAQNKKENPEPYLNKTISEQNQNPLSKNNPSIKSLRTFKTDAEEAVRYQNISAAQIALAEQRKREASQPIKYEKEGSGLIITAIISIIVVIIVFASIYYYTKIINKNIVSNIPKELSIKSIIPYNKGDILETETGKNPIISIGEKLSSITNDSKLGDIYNLVIMPNGTTTVTHTFQSIISNTRIPNILSRSIIPNEYMIGSYISNINSPFIIIKNTFFQNAFAGMLEWEKYMRNDLINLIRVSYPEETTTGTIGDIFEDTVLSNIDVRLLKNNNNNVILAYGFVDKDTIVMSTNLETLSFIFSKLLAVQVVQ